MKRFKYMYLGSIIIIATVIYSFASSTTIYEEIPAVKYRLGEEGIIENVTILIDGKYKKNLFSDDIFTGTIYIEGYDFTIKNSGFSNLESTLSDIQIDGKGHGTYDYVMLDSEKKVQHLMQGEIFVKDNFSIITMTINEDQGWNSQDGIMLSGPAETRKEALEIANSLLVDIKLPLK